MMQDKITVTQSGLHCVIAIAENADVRFLHFSPLPFDEKTVGDDEQQKHFRLVELQVTGENHDELHDTKHIGTMPGNRLRYHHHRDEQTIYGRKLTIVMNDEHTGLIVEHHMQFYDHLPIMRCWNFVINSSANRVGLEYLSSFTLTGLAKEGSGDWEQKMQLYVPHNTWRGEMQWRKYRLPELGLSDVSTFSTKRLVFNSMGTWSTSQYLPMGAIENRETGSCLFWQIEHNGEWLWELSDVQNHHLYLQLSGPTEQEHQCWKLLQPGETFTSVPVAVGAIKGSIEEAMSELTTYRRIIRRANRDNENLPVIFNDYMNCLEGDPTTSSLSERNGHSPSVMVYW